MPLVGFGLWKVDNATAADTVYNAIKVGYRLFDGACGESIPVTSKSEQEEKYRPGHAGGLNAAKKNACTRKQGGQPLPLSQLSAREGSRSTNHSAPPHTAVSPPEGSYPEPHHTSVYIHPQPGEQFLFIILCLFSSSSSLSLKPRNLSHEESPLTASPPRRLRQREGVRRGRRSRHKGRSCQA